jgi:release factor glutamine methyltransferase
VTYGELIASVSKKFESSETPYLDASLIIAASFGIERSRLITMLPETPPSTPRNLARSIERRKSGESIAYILGYKEFWGRRFNVDKRVLVPRPDTELLVELALRFGDDLSSRLANSGDEHTGKGTKVSVHDLCTGSGAVAISVACERIDWSVSASDISADALDVARGNSAALCGHDIPFVESDLLDRVSGVFDIITANPPYIPSSEASALLSKGWGEPSRALDGGPNGLRLYPRLIEQAYEHLVPGGILLLESDPSQTTTLRGMFEKEGFKFVGIWKDLAGLDRICGGQRPGTSGIGI